MRRLLVLLAGLGVLPAATGCYHTAGKCDCVPPVQPCCIYGLYPPAAGLPVLPATVTPVSAEQPASHTTPATPPARESIGLPRDM